MPGPIIANARIDVDLDGDAIPRQAKQIAAAAGGSIGKELVPWGEKAGRQLGHAVADGFDADDFAHRVGEDSKSALAREFEKLGDRAIVDPIASSVRRASPKVAREMRTAGVKGGEEFGRGVGDGGDRWFVRWGRDLRVSASKIGGVAGQALGGAFNSRLRRNLIRSRRNVDTEFRGMLGSLRGARNDFLNIVGIIGGSMERLVSQGLGKSFDLAGQAISGLAAKLSETNGPLSGFGDQLGQVGDKVQGLGKGGLDGLVIQLGVFALAVQAVVIAIGPLVAGVSGLVGALTALAVTLGGYLLGALISLGPILVALGAAAGAAVIGFLGMSDAMKDSLQPLQDWYDTAKEISSNALFANIGDQANQLASILQTNLNPLLEASGTAISEWADRFLEAMQGPAMTAAAEVLNTELPNILTNLLDTFTSVSEGLGSLFQAIAPTVTEVTGYISDAAAAFAEWAASAEGQESIKTFFEEAAQTGQILWDIVKGVSRVIGDLFSAGNENGQYMLQTIADLVTQFADWLDTDDGRAELESWFTNAASVARVLGTAIAALVELFVALDTPANRMFFRLVGDSIVDLIGAVTTVIGWIESLIGFFTGLGRATDSAGSAISGAASGIESAWGGIVSFFEGVWDGILNAADSVASALSAAWTAVQEAPQRVQDWFNNTLVPFFQTLPERMWQGFLGLVERAAALPGQIIGALANLGSMLLEFFTTAFTNVTTAVSTGVTNTLTFFRTLPARALAAIRSLGTSLGAFFSRTWTTARTAVSTGVSNVLTFFRNLPSRALAAVNSLLSSLGSFFSRVWTNARTAVVNGVNNVIATIKELPGKAFNALLTLGSQLFTAIANGFGEGGRAALEGISNLVNKVKEIPGKVGDALSNLGSTLYQAGRDLIQGLINGVSSMASNAVSSVKNLGSDMVSGVKGILGIGSPSKVFADIGEDVVAGLVVGIDKNENKAVTAVDNLGTALIPDWSGKNLAPAGGGSGGGGGAGGGGRTIIVEEGAIQYTTPLSDPRLVAIQSLDQLVVRIGG